MLFKIAQDFEHILSLGLMEYGNVEFHLPEIQNNLYEGKMK